MGLIEQGKLRTQVELFVLRRKILLTGLNHLTFAVTNLEASLAFYRDLLGCRCHVIWERGAYLTMGELWLCLSLGEVSPAKDYTHVAFSVSKKDFPILAKALMAAGVPEWKTNKSEGDSLYILDPDNHRLEIHVGSLASRLAELKTHPYQNLVWLDSHE